MAASTEPGSDTGSDTGSLPGRLRGLLQAQAYPHAVDTVRLVETHISWVLLSGGFAYKIKKPVHLSFVDFSTLEKRRLACEEELRLNRRLAPELYLDVVPIGDDAGKARIGGAVAVEWAVKMRRFAEQDQLDRRLAAGSVTPAQIEAFAQALAAFHAGCPAAPPGADWGQPERVQAQVRDNFREALQLAAPGEREQIERLRDWSEVRFALLRADLQQRRSEGRIREGHGDLHLANLVYWQGRILAFDCLEFDPALRCIDVMSDAGFLVMDLLCYGHNALAYRFLNAYLEAGGDYRGLRLLRYYMVYRAMVRAKVAMMRRASASGAPRQTAARRAEIHLQLASRLSAPAQPALILMHGLSGAGKSWLSAHLAAALPAIRLRSDVERKRLHALHGEQRGAAVGPGEGLGEGLYSATATAQTYRCLLSLAQAALEGGESVIVDATFLQAERRRLFRMLAQRLRACCLVVACTAPDAELRRRIVARARSGDASDADLTVLDDQLRRHEDAQPDEEACWLRVDSSADCDAEGVAETLRQRLAAYAAGADQDSVPSSS